MPARHDLVWLTPAGWDAARARLDGSAAALAARWRDHDWPAIVRRTAPGTPADDVCLGLPAPPDPVTGHKPRAGLAAARADIASMRPPLALDEIDPPGQWRAPFAQLRDALRAAGIDCRVYGSVAMQAITGEPYIGPASDIDVLLRPASALQLEAGLDLLARFAAHLPLDGEIAFPSGHAVSWKEWLGAGATDARVLAKHLERVALMRCDELRCELERDARA